MQLSEPKPIAYGHTDVFKNIHIILVQLVNIYSHISEL